MSLGKKQKNDYDSLPPPVRKTEAPDRQSLKPPRKDRSRRAPLKNSIKNSENKKGNSFEPKEKNNSARANSRFVKSEADEVGQINEHAERQLVRQKKSERAESGRELLQSDRWFFRNGHLLTYAGLYLFSVLVFFRPYELASSLSFLSATAMYFALATLIVYLPAQISAEGSLTVLTTEIKCVLALTLIALITMPIAKSPALAWEEFNDPFIKVVLMFVVMVNVLRTRRRLMGLMWLSLGMGIYLSYTALAMFSRGELNAEGYRVAVEIGGMFGNPNEMALHLLMMTPISLCLGLAAKSGFMRALYFAVTALFIGANFVTYSRGGFLGLLAVAVVLVWKLGRKNRLKVTVGASAVGIVTLLLAPGNYGLRVLSIFVPGLDPVGSSDQRRELLERSILVTMRNPWGIGIGNFQVVGVQNLVSHNAYTQVSSELGLLGLAAYMIFMISPFRKLWAIENIRVAEDRRDWYYYLSIGLQASIVGYMVSSFFASVAYNWFIYYLIAYAVAFRRIYAAEDRAGAKEKPVEGFSPLRTA